MPDQPAASEVVQKKDSRSSRRSPNAGIIHTATKAPPLGKRSWTRWVKSQQCVCCNKQTDDPHHLIGHGQVEWERKRTTCCVAAARAHHDELHADTVAFEEKHGSQLELLFPISGSFAGNWRAGIVENA